MHSLLEPIKTYLRSLNCPLSVEFNPTRPGLTIAKNGIVFSLDDEGGDELLSWLATLNHKTPWLMKIGCKFRVYAKSSKEAAAVWEHQALARAVVDQVLCSIRAVVSAEKTIFEVKKLGFVSKEQLKLEGLEAWPGVVYETTFSIARPVFERKWTGESTRETGNVDTVQNTVTAGE